MLGTIYGALARSLIRALASAPQTFQIGRSALGPKGRGLLSTLTKIVRTIHNHLYMKIIRSLHFVNLPAPTI